MNILLLSVNIDTKIREENQNHSIRKILSLTIFRLSTQQRQLGKNLKVYLKFLTLKVGFKIADLFKNYLQHNELLLDLTRRDLFGVKCFLIIFIIPRQRQYKTSYLSVQVTVANVVLIYYFFLLELDHY